MKSASADRRRALTDIWKAAVGAVGGRVAVHHAVDADDAFAPDLIVAVGKAASGMCLGALDRFPGTEALVVTKYEHAEAELEEHAGVEIIEAGHPIPDLNSLHAGARLRERVAALGEASRLLLLVSGGASALAEALPEGMALTDLQAETDAMIAGGKTIAQINARRKQISRIKDGKLIEVFQGAEARVYAISDVEGDSIETIGSGLGDCCCAEAKCRARIIASNGIARARAAQRALELGYEMRANEESLYGDVFELAPRIGALLEDAAPGIYIWGGEPTVVLPPNPGRGGRNQSLALALAEGLAGRDDISLLVAGTDGTDGPTEAAGGIVDGDTWGDADLARSALERADAGPYLEARDSLFVTGPTHTNVMDLAIAIVE